MKNNVTLTITCLLSIAVIAVASAVAAAGAAGALPIQPDTLAVESDGLHLRALFYRPAGPGPFPGVLINHGSGHAAGVDRTGVPDHRHPEIHGPLFAAHGYAALYLFRRGDGLSRGQGSADADVLDQSAEHGQDERNRIQIERLEHEDMHDALAGLAVLRARPEVDPRRIAIVGHSFGGSLSVLVAGRDTTLRAAVLFATAGYSWMRSPELRERLLEAVARSHAPMLFIHAANDYTIASGESLAAELHRLGKRGQVRIYPAVGHTPDDGHAFVDTGVATWERDVFTFLDPLMKR